MASRYVDNTDQVQRQMRQAMLAALQNVADDLLDDANRTIPVATGAMRDSGRAETEETSTGVRAVVSYDTPYAVRQHEDLSLSHRSGQRAMWLTYAARENQRKYQVYLAGEVKKKAGGSWV